MTGFSTIEEGIEEIRQGRILLVVDDEDRENEGDLVMAADRVTPEAVNFMAKHGRGLICVPLLGERLDDLKISMMVSDNTAPMGTAFTVTVDARRGVTTGTSAYDRAVTIRTLVDPLMRADDLTRPGHILPLRAMGGGVLRRAGHTEAAIDLARLAGCYPAGVICEVLDEDGGMARVPHLTELARSHGLKMITIRDLIEYRIHKEKLVRRIATTKLPTDFGEFSAIAYDTTVDSRVPLALVMGSVTGDSPVLVRVHSECLTGDVFHSRRCDCGLQPEKALGSIQLEGRGVMVSTSPSACRSRSRRRRPTGNTSAPSATSSAPVVVTPGLRWPVALPSSAGQRYVPHRSGSRSSRRDSTSASPSAWSAALGRRSSRREWAPTRSRCTGCRAPSSSPRRQVIWPRRAASPGSSASAS